MFGGIVDSLTGGSRTGASQSTTNAPWQPSQEYLLDVYENSRNAFQAAQKPNAAQQQSWDQRTALAPSLAGPTGEYSQMVQQMAGGGFLRPESNPYLQANITAATRPMTDSFTRSFLPNVSSAAIQQGAYGGSRQGIVEALGASELSRNVGDMASGMIDQNYQRERQNQLMIPQLQAALAQMQLMPSNVLGQVGQEQINQNWDPIQRYQALVAGMPQFNQSQTTQQDSGLSSVLNIANTLGGLFG